MRRVYLSSRFGRREEMRAIATSLRARGHIVTSTWHDGDGDDGSLGGSAPALALREAQEIGSSDTFVAFTEEPGAQIGQRGGRHAEFGMAFVMRLRMVVVGPAEHLFHSLPSVWRCETTADMVRHLDVAHAFDRDAPEVTP